MAKIGEPFIYEQTSIHEEARIMAGEATTCPDCGWPRGSVTCRKFCPMAEMTPERIAEMRARFAAYDAYSDVVEALDALTHAQQEIADLRAVIKKAADECLDCDGTNEIDTTSGRMACVSCYGLRAALAPRSPGETGGTT